MTDWNKFGSRIPWPKEGERHVIAREQMLKEDPRNKAKILLGTEGGEILSIWPSQLGPIADYFVAHPKALNVVVNWTRNEDGRVVASVEALDV